MKRNSQQQKTAKRQRKYPNEKQLNKLQLRKERRVLILKMSIRNNQNDENQSKNNEK